MKIMIVDDEPTIRSGLRVLLANSFEQVVVTAEARNGKEALQLLEETRADVMILTDIRMPVMDGLQLIQSVKTHYPHVECIILTGHSDFEYARLALHFGVADYLIKPITQEKLNEAILRIISRNPNHWISQISPSIILDIKKTVDCLVKFITSGDVINLLQTVSDWQAKCLALDLNPTLQKHLLGYMKLAYETELLASWPSMPVLGSAFGSSEIHEHEAYEYWKADLLEKASWISARTSPRNRRIYEQVMTYMHIHYVNPALSIHDIAAHCGVTAAYLSKLIRDTAQKPLTTLLSDLRMEKAKKLLQKLDDSTISAVAENCGFGDYPHFSKLFKKMFGVSPQEFRDKQHTN